MGNNKRAVIMLVLIGMLLPVAVSVGGAWWMQSMADVLPEMVGTHWGAGGTADSFTSLETVILWTLVAGVAVPVVGVGGVTAYVAWKGASPNAVVTAATIAGMTVFTVVLVVTSTIGQGPEAVLPWWSIPVSLGAGGAVGLLSWVGIPRSHSTERMDVPSLPVPPAKSTHWEGKSTMSGFASFVLWGGVALLVIVTVALLFGGAEPSVVATLGALSVVIALVSFLLSRVKVDISRGGLKVSSPIPWPSVRIPLDEIHEAQLVLVDPMLQFGGWGYRLGMGGTGIILSKGPAIRVRYKDGRYLTVTAEHADKGAAVLIKLLGQESEFARKG